MRIEDLNTIETTAEMWLDFCNVSMSSQFYQVALNRTTDPEQAAALTLLRNYMSTFSKAERVRLEQEPEFFYKYARGFIEELAPYRYGTPAYDRDVRAGFIGKIRTLLAAQKDAQGQIQDENTYIFIRTIVKFCSSLKFICEVHDQYKRFLFRELPQIRTAALDD